jgi:hypothetical protein
MTIVREAYLDFYSKSLQPENNHHKYAYSKRMNEESKDHQVRQEKIFRGQLEGLMKEYSVHPLQNKEKIEDTISFKTLNTFKN